MTRKYRAEIYQTGKLDPFHRLYANSWSCREFAQRDIGHRVVSRRYVGTPLTVRLAGLNMRNRDMIEQEGMAKFASLLLPNNPIDTDHTSIWIELVTDDSGHLIYPAREVYSLMHFYIKYLSVQMQNRVSFEQVCKALIARKHPVFHGIPDQQLGNALYFFSYVNYPKEMMKFNKLLSSGSGPGTAMRCLANLEEEATGVPIEAAKFYYAVLEEWCRLFKRELRSTVNYHTKDYARFWYLPLIIQDVYNRVYDGDGKFDNVEYGDDEW